MDKDNGREGVPRSAYSAAEGAAHERWLVDPAGSRLTFSLRHFVLHRIEGEFIRWGGTLSIDRGQPALSVVELWIDLASISTGDAERDAHVRSAEFLDVEHFPVAKFRSERVRLRDGQVTVDGRLDLRGMSRDIRVDIEINPSDTAATGQVRTSYKARAVVDRQAFGLHWNQDLDVGGIVVGDQVEIRADVQVARVDDKGDLS
jgi:polyisoprenoid-binding protein YceI